MTDQNQVPNQIPSTNVEESPMASDWNYWKGLAGKVKPASKNAFDKLYSNKKIFWPVSIAICLILLVILLGFVFGKARPGPTKKILPTATPFVQATPQATTSGDIIINSQIKLNSLKDQINNLDVHQNRLQPPVLNFDVKF